MTKSTDEKNERKQAAAIYQNAHIEALMYIDRDDALDAAASHLVRLAAAAVAGDKTARAMLLRAHRAALDVDKKTKATVMRLAHMAVDGSMRVFRTDGAAMTKDDHADLAIKYLARDFPHVKLDRVRVAAVFDPVHVPRRRDARAAAIAGLILGETIDAETVRTHIKRSRRRLKK